MYVISTEIQPKNLKLVHYYFLVVPDNIQQVPEPPIEPPLLYAPGELIEIQNIF